MSNFEKLQQQKKAISMMKESEAMKVELFGI